MSFDRTSHDDHSIWASRPSLLDPEGTGITPFPHGRARAGTLPSRFPSRLDPTMSNPRQDLTVDSSHHGSLALISPDGNDIVYDRPISTTSRLAVGQQIAGGPSITEPIRRSPPLAPILEPPHSGTNSVASSLGKPMSGNTPLATPMGTPLSTPLHSGGRTRSGSLNSLASNGSYRPFGHSIWDQPVHGHSLSSTQLNLASSVAPFPSISSHPSTPHKQPQPQAQTQPQPQTQIQSPISANTAAASSAAPGLNSHDPLLIFANEINKSAAPNRIRSYTLDTKDWAVPQPTQPFTPFVRSRAQTLFDGSLSNPIPSPSLGRFGKQHTLQHDASSLLGSTPIGGELSHVPTQALWVSNVPPQTTPYTLHSIFGSFGRIEAARVVPNRHCAYVVFASAVNAVEAQAAANGYELFSGNGPSTVAFVQVGPMTNNLAGAGLSIGGFGPLQSNGATRTSSPVDPTLLGSSGSSDMNGSKISLTGTIPTSHSANNSVGSISSVGSTASSNGAGATPGSASYILQVLGADKKEVLAEVALLNRTTNINFNVPIPPLSELLDKDGERTFNTATLRELRRKLENQPQSLDIVDIALDMQQELPILASDYIGNTIVQHVFEAAPPVIRDMMFRRLMGVFAATGTHKNGTWAVQKMIDLARGPRQYYLCEQAIEPHLVPLLLDQFGNYVVQGCLKFGAPYSDFVYAGIAASLAKIAPNRFGARAIRAVLESKYTDVASQRLVATAIAQQLPTLASNANGCLLVSWLLDHAHCPTSDTHEKKNNDHSSNSSNPDNREASAHNGDTGSNGNTTENSTDPKALAQQLKTHALVAAQLIPQHLVSLCTSKLGSNIILKLASSPGTASSQRVFDALFEPISDDVSPALVEIINDPSNQGASCISRLLSVFPENSLEKQVATNKVRAALISSGTGASHRRLMEDVGLEPVVPPSENATTEAASESSEALNKTETTSAETAKSESK